MADNVPTQVRTATKHRDDHSKTLDGVTADRWQNHGHDRLYINGLFSGTTDVYVDLTDDSVTVSGTKIRQATTERDGDTLTVSIKRPSARYEIVLETAGTDVQTDDIEDESDDSDVDLERFGVDI